MVVFSDECVVVLIDNHVQRFTAASPSAVSCEICQPCWMFNLFHLILKIFRSARSVWWTWLAVREPTQPELKEPD